MQKDSHEQHRRYKGPIPGPVPPAPQLRCIWQSSQGFLQPPSGGQTCKPVTGPRMAQPEAPALPTRQTAPQQGHSKAWCQGLGPPGATATHRIAELPTTPPQAP